MDHKIIKIGTESRHDRDENMHWEGTECCGVCGNEFDFVFDPSNGVTVVCPHCGTEQHPCSLCTVCDSECEQNLSIDGIGYVRNRQQAEHFIGSCEPHDEYVYIFKTGKEYNYPVDLDLFW